MIRAALEMRASHHPEVIARTDRLLWSLNQRTGDLLRAMKFPDTGQDIPPMDTFYLDELVALAEAKARALEEAVEEARRGR